MRRRSKRKQTQESNDPVLPEKKRARRRLVGAIALVLAAVIGLPMILDSEPKPLATDISIEIPSKDKQPAQAAVKAPAPAVLPPEVSLDKDEEIIAPSNEDENKPEPIAERKDNAAQESLSEAKPVPVKTEKNANEERARALLSGEPDPAKEKAKTAGDSKNGKFVVQIAALASQQKVNELQNKLKSAGIKSYTSKVATQSGERIRVRIGPFSSKEEAEKVRAKLVKLGLGGTLVPV
ncbi:MAG: SPOR domain-containing protein [Burkholderiaceae bacterium]